MKTVIKDFSFEGLKLVKIGPFNDERGFFVESWNKKTFKEAGLDVEFVQECHSGSGKSVVRGLHSQDASHPVGKLVRCTVGEIMDVAVDIRHTSVTFGRHVALKLSAEIKDHLYIPPGFLHGFCVLSDYAEVQYKQTGFYAPGHEIHIAWDDPDLKIKWMVENPVLSEKDKGGISFASYMANPEF